MEDMIIKKLCNFCMNKCKDCMNYKEYKQSNLIVYGCNNYAKNEEKIRGYEGKWIDSTLTQIAIKSIKKGVNRQK